MLSSRRPVRTAVSDATVQRPNPHKSLRKQRQERGRQSTLLTKSSAVKVCIMIVAFGFTIGVILVLHESQWTQPTERITPFTSHPPRATRFNRTYVRHECIEAIRTRHRLALAPYLSTANLTHVLLVDPAYHSNVGDHMITVGELDFLRRTLPTSLVVEQCSYTQAGDYVPKCRDLLQHNTDATSYKVAIWHGGGNFGDLWPLAQEARIESLQPLLKAGYTIVTMPNSWYYSNPRTETRDVQRIRHAIRAGLNATTVSESQLVHHASARMIWTWREQLSYQRGLEHFPYCTNILMPDIAFQLGPYTKIPPPPPSLPRITSSVSKPATTLGTDILFLLRDDHESMYASQRNRQAIHRVMQQALDDVGRSNDVTFSIVDWKDRLARFDSDDFFFTDTAIQLLSLGRVVICDRLHAAILAYLTTGLPFVYLDQLTGKITKTLSVAMESDGCQQQAGSAMWSSAQNLTDAIQKAILFLDQGQASNKGVLTREQRRDLLRKKMGQSK